MSTLIPQILDLLDREFGAFVLLARVSAGNVAAVANWKGDKDGRLRANVEHALSELLRDTEGTDGAALIPFGRRDE